MGNNQYVVTGYSHAFSFVQCRLKRKGKGDRDMEENTQNMEQGQETDRTAGQETEEKTFTQEEVNRIVTSRLSRDREQTLKELNRREQELAQREFRLNSRQKLIDRGYPESLLDALNCSSEETLEKSIDAIEDLIRERMKNGEGASGFHAVGVKNEYRLGAGEDPIRKAMNL